MAVMQYGGNFLAVGGFSFSAVTTLAKEVTKTWRYFSAVMQYGGFFLSVSGFSFFGGNVNVDSKLGVSCGA